MSRHRTACLVACAPAPRSPESIIDTFDWVPTPAPRNPLPQPRTKSQLHPVTLPSSETRVFIDGQRLNRLEAIGYIEGGYADREVEIDAFDLIDRDPVLLALLKYGDYDVLAPHKLEHPRFSGLGKDRLRYNGLQDRSYIHALHVQARYLADTNADENTQKLFGLKSSKGHRKGRHATHPDWWEEMRSTKWDTCRDRKLRIRDKWRRKVTQAKRAHEQWLTAYYFAEREAVEVPAPVIDFEDNLEDDYDVIDWDWESPGIAAWLDLTVWDSRQRDWVLPDEYVPVSVYDYEYWFDEEPLEQSGSSDLLPDWDDYSAMYWEDSSWYLGDGTCSICGHYVCVDVEGFPLGESHNSPVFDGVTLVNALMATLAPELPPYDPYYDMSFTDVIMAEVNPDDIVQDTDIPPHKYTHPRVLQNNWLSKRQSREDRRDRHNYFLRKQRRKRRERVYAGIAERQMSRTAA